MVVSPAALEIKITEDMVSAGSVVYEYWRDSDEYNYRAMVGQVYETMRALAASKVPGDQR